MLQKLTEEIANCYAPASECRERRWIMLAQSYEVSERISNFQGVVRRRCFGSAGTANWCSTSSRAPPNNLLAGQERVPAPLP
jgi:hypothetical protein